MWHRCHGAQQKRASTEADAMERKQPIVVRLMVTASGPPLPSPVPPWNRRSPVLRGRGFSSRCSIKTKFKNGRRLTWFRSYPLSTWLSPPMGQKRSADRSRRPLDNERPTTTYLSVAALPPAVTGSPRGTGEVPRREGGASPWENDNPNKVQKWATGGWPGTFSTGSGRTGALGFFGKDGTCTADHEAIRCLCSHRRA